MDEQDDETWLFNIVFNEVAEERMFVFGFTEVETFAEQGETDFLFFMVDLEGGNQCKELALSNITWTSEDESADSTTTYWKEITTKDF